LLYVRFSKDHITARIKMLKEKNNFDLLEQTIHGAELERRTQIQRLAEHSGTFNGMYHIFDHHKSTVTRIHFANNEKSLFACCSADGNLSICQLFPEPATVIYILKGHTSSVSDFQWSLSNDLIVSGSFDCTVRVWCTSSGKCLRVIQDPTGSPVSVCCFQPINNNMVIVGNHKGYLHVLNVSTGIPVKAGSVRVNTASRIQCITLDNDGRTVWVGDSKGFVSSYSFDLKSGSLTRLTKCIISQDASVTSLSVKNYVYNNDAKGKFLLVNCCTNSVSVFRIDSEMKLRLKYTLSVKHQDRSMLVKSKFCPLAITKENAGLACGSEDCCVYFYTELDFFGSEDSNLPKLTKLQGHSSPVLDVCFNCDESLLASSDTAGVVIIWKKDITPF
jgi:WD40 repeat protein